MTKSNLLSSFARLSAVGIFSVSVLFSGCSKPDQQDPQLDEPIPAAVNADSNASGDSDSGTAAGLQTVNFPYDSFVLDEQGKATLAGNVQILKDKPSLAIQVEGHCDERGGIQYNIALGEKRANAVRRYLTSQGVQAERVTTISFGKERPVDQGKTEEAYAKNRRANFVITSR